MASLHFKDFRNMEPGDRGHWYKAREGGRSVSYKDMPEHGRWKFSPSTHEVIPMREFQSRARGGVTYTEYVQKREQQGIPKQQYRPRTREPTKEPAAKFRRITEKQREVKQQQLGQILRRMVTTKDAALHRRDILQEAWAKKRSEEYGYPLKFDELPSEDQGAFWHYYHLVVDGGQIETFDEFQAQYSDYFEIDDEGDFYDIEYGTTP